MPEQSTFITNVRGKTLKERIIELIHVSKELKFLVGFFYFSGFRELYSALKDNPHLHLQTLVGLDVDKYVNNLVEIDDPRENRSSNECVDQYLSSLKISINSDEFDCREFAEHAHLAIQLILNNQLIIRKTYHPNHAKLYIFKIKEQHKTLRESFMITGSSNFSRSGLGAQGEFNVEISDYGTDEAERFFDTLWETAVPLTEKMEIRERMIHVLRNETLVAEPTPFEAYALILKTYLDTHKPTSLKGHVLTLLEQRGYKNYAFQTDAVSQALSILRQCNGVLIADVVGLGKSIIASLMAKHLGTRGIIICPPSLIGDDNHTSGWQKYREDFELHDWDIRSSGELDKVAEFIRDHDDIETVIIDEAHRFRNQDTQDYEHLSNICRGRKVILLTATPFNNAPKDIFSMLKLFEIPKKSRITLDDNMEAKFASYQSEFEKLAYIFKNLKSGIQKNQAKARKFHDDLFGGDQVDIAKVKARGRQLAKMIKAELEPVVIRRNRIDLKNDPDYRKEINDLPRVNDPEELYYELDARQSRFYDEIITGYFGEEGRFTGAIYRPFTYELSEEEFKKRGEEENIEFFQQANLASFMRRLLVKRFESSFGAFRQSIENFKALTEKVLRFIDHSGGMYILDRTLLEKISQWDEDAIADELDRFREALAPDKIDSKKYKAYDVNRFARKQDFLSDIRSDLKMFDEILKQLEELDLVGHDPKAFRLISQVRTLLKQKEGGIIRKIVIFTEYIDTVKHVEQGLNKHFAGRFLTVKGGLSSTLARQILENFDAAYRKQSDDFDVLLTTDKVSEGVNLNRAGAVINYDIPWNPTRVIQRVGRINRISRKVFDELFIFNFFPTQKGEKITKSREIATNKMFLIHNALGEDAKIFEADEEPSPAALFKKIQANPEEGEEESFMTLVRRKFRDIQGRYPDVIRRISQLPSRVKTAKKGTMDTLLAFIRKGPGCYVRGLDILPYRDADVRQYAMPDILPMIECTPDEPRRPLSPHFWEGYRSIKEYRSVEYHPSSDISNETKARNILETLVGLSESSLDPLRSFIRMLLEDLHDYKTLTPRTLRRIAVLKSSPDRPNEFKRTIDELGQIRIEMGGNYLDKVKKSVADITSEVIIAVENQK